MRFSAQQGKGGVPRLTTGAACMMALVALVAACAQLPPLAVTRYHNPVLYADYSDPDVIRDGRNYYLVASSFHFSPGIPILKSADLVHWKLVGHVLAKLPFAPEYNMVPPFTLTDAVPYPVGPGLRYAGGVWAPAIRKHRGLFYVFWPTPQEGIFMATATRPEGPWSTPVAVVPGPGLEDPCPFWDDDGKAYLVHSRVGAGPLILHEMTPDGTRVLDDGTIIVHDPKNLPTLEGPKLYKRHGWYYIFAPIGGVEAGSEVVLRSRNIRGPYDWHVVLQRGTTSVHGPHQGGYVETPSGQGWFIHFNSTGAFGRIDYLEPVEWLEDWPVVGKPIEGTTAGEPVSDFQMPQTGASFTGDHLQDSDEFDASTLGPQWEWNHNPDDALWSLNARPGFLRLIAGPSENLVTARNTITQILQGPEMEATVRLDISHLTEGQRAGLAMFGIRPSWIGVVRSGGRAVVTFSSAGAETSGPALVGQTVELRVDVAADQTARFSFSTDGGVRFQPLGESSRLWFSWWKGARPALFTYIKAPPETAVPRGYVDVDWFRVGH